MNTLDAIEKRRSIRNFEMTVVEKDEINTLINAANQAPSACNVQGWRFIIIDKQELKNKIFDMGGSVIIKNAPVGILVLYDNRTTNYEYHDHIQSASAAIQNISLAAIDIGLGTCWVCHLPPKRHLRKLLGIPKYFSPIAYVLVGHPKAQPKIMPRKYKLEEIMNFNKYSADWPVEKIDTFKIFFKKILIRVYYFTPEFIKKTFLNKILDKKYVKKFDN